MRRALLHLARLPGAVGWVGLAMLGAFGLIALLAPWLSPYAPDAYAGDPLLSPGSSHWLGTNDMGHDILSELLWGSRTAVVLALVVGVLSTTIAASVALLSATRGGWTDRLAMRLVDLFLAVPRLPLIIVIAAFVGSSVSNLVAVLVAFSWARGARVLRSQARSLVCQPHVEAAWLCGASDRYLIAHHLVPELLPLLGYKLTKAARFALVAEAGLAFLGIGDPTHKSWGMMLYHLQSYPGVYYTNVWLWWFGPPALCLTLMILALVLLQHRLEEVANPTAGVERGQR